MKTRTTKEMTTAVSTKTKVSCGGRKTLVRLALLVAKAADSKLKFNHHFSFDELKKLWGVNVISSCSITAMERTAKYHGVDFHVSISGLPGKYRYARVACTDLSKVIAQLQIQVGDEVNLNKAIRLCRKMEAEKKVVRPVKKMATVGKTVGAGAFSKALLTAQAYEAVEAELAKKRTKRVKKTSSKA